MIIGHLEAQLKGLGTVHRMTALKVPTNMTTSSRRWTLNSLNASGRHSRCADRMADTCLVQAPRTKPLAVGCVQQVCSHSGWSLSGEAKQLELDFSSKRHSRALEFCWFDSRQPNRLIWYEWGSLAQAAVPAVGEIIVSDSKAS